MADASGPQNLTFPPVLPWQIGQTAQQNSPLAHRQLQYHPNHFPTGNTQYYSLIIQTDPTTNTTSRMYMWPRLLSRAVVTTSRRLKRFADVRNRLQFEGAPPPKTNNNFQFTTPTASAYRVLTRVLELVSRAHQLDVIQPNYIVDNANQIDNVVVEGTRYAELVQTIRTLPAALAQIEDRNFASQHGGLRPRFQWLNNFSNSLVDCLYEMEAVENWVSTRPDNPDTHRVHAIAAAEQNIPEMTRLLAFILEREQTFYDLFTLEHVFGCLLDKRLILLSPAQLAELYEIFNILPLQAATANGTPAPPVLFEWSSSASRVYESVYNHRLADLYTYFHRHQMELRNTFEYRQLVEWGLKPLWKKLYVTVSPELGISDNTIDEFLQWTKLDHLTSNFFTIHPVRSDRFDNVPCVICFEDLGTFDGIQGKMLVELKCGHFYHTECLIPHFDQFNRWSNRCPTCRQPAGSLRDMVDGYNVEAQDIDYDLPQTQTDGRFTRDELYCSLYRQRLQDMISTRNVGPDHHTAYWQRLLDQLLGRKRARRQANCDWNNTLSYGT